MPEDSIEQVNFEEINKKAISQPLVSNIYTADPSAHVFNNKIYIYPSHDIDAGIPFNDNGDHFGMEDYHVFSMETIKSEAVDHGVALHVADVAWAEKQMWAPDAACKNGKYYLYFPAKRANGIFQIGVAISDSPEGPFTPEPQPIAGSYSIDPAVFEDEDGKYYIYFGGIWGGQLQKYRANTYDPDYEEPSKNEPALGPIVALLTEDMLEFAETPKEIQILDENGKNILAGDNDRRFFEASWVHKYNGKYYFSYSTGDTHFICYATGDNPYGPFTYQGRILNPVIGWTSHHSICKVDNEWYLFYHDSSLSKGVTHLRSIKVTKIEYLEDGSIVTINPYGMAGIAD
ncbi:glycoside hydrolase family 43 protein [Flavobacterium sp. Fl-77]|uniref:Glycoside hydrolase family 43 protein n=1 Tax=Flavobacterium flavipigmentatum TaxID=2893884 RepID=A0AAJ2VY62_9FLAO|nr:MULTISPECIES: glycoside hydrolase family 43 protein [unclassified Flavobacterium]MDX6182761.1 glycoside hydrolase family 43 protein [Flavobacterium sp. Fl-33]MDX6186060.1 glycoside hydrolase family 43 protein [Flavobacterium sp. Fl-77]UFH38212.1 glycoside hydrolase family 43 protein [Flavobacterium sp. F-70]